jgi:maltose O-acetyltransferase
LNASSRTWNWFVNRYAASPLLRGKDRRGAYSQAGLDIQTDYIGPSCVFSSSLIRVGARTVINDGCHIEGSAPVDIGEDVALAAYVLILTSSHEFGDSSRRAGEWTRESVSVGSGCWIGARVVVLAGVTIGPGCIVAAGAVVTEDCEANGLYAGVPARRVRDLAT